MGDEPRRADSTKPLPPFAPPGAGTKISPRAIRTWSNLHALFGQRWIDNYGSVPSPLWQKAIDDDLTPAQVRAGIDRLMKSAAEHPPTLPQFLDLCRNVASVRVEAPRREVDRAHACTAQWFLHRLVRQRFVGIIEHSGNQSLFDLQAEVLAIARDHFMLVEENDPSATPERFMELADAAAERIYPERLAIAARNAA